MTTLKKMTFKTEEGAQLGRRLRASEAAVKNILNCAKKDDSNWFLESRKPTESSSIYPAELFSHRRSGSSLD
jgi:hypothetical protein